MPRQLSVIIPVCERADNTVALYHKYRKVLSSTGYQFEYLFVINAKYHSVYQTLQAEKQQGEPLRIISFSQNFGEANAIDIGAQYAGFEELLILPAYEQVETETLPQLLEAMDDNDMVIVKRWPRVDGFFNKIQNRLFQKMVWTLTGDAISDLGCGVRLLKKEVLRDVSLYGDQHRFLPLLAAQKGFRITEISLPQAKTDSHVRIYSPGTYLRRFLDLATILFLTRFNKKPLRFFGLIGSLSASIGIIGLLYLCYERFVLDISMADRPLLVLFVLFLILGVQLVAIGLVGETIVFVQGKRNREYHIREIIN